MERRFGGEGTYRVLPDDGQPCVWMVGGLLTYKLCDRGFDCDHCPLDAALRGVEPAPPSRAIGTGTDRADAPPATEIRDGLRYHPIHGWVSDAADGRLRWGLDGVTARLLDRVTSFVLPAIGTELVQGQTACWAMDDGELLPLRTPVSGRVARLNAIVQRDPAMASRSPYDLGWLVEVDPREGPGAARGLCDAEERRREAARQWARIRRAVMAHLHMHQGIGPTSQDGGERLADLRQVLGRSRYHRLVRTILR